MRIGDFCLGFPHTLSAPAIFIYLFIYLFAVFITWSLSGREDPGNEGYSFRLLSFGEFGLGFLGAINLQGKENSYKRRKVE